jgi:hypothetical protein
MRANEAVIFLWDGKDDNENPLFVRVSGIQLVSDLRYACLGIAAVPSDLQDLPEHIALPRIELRYNNTLLADPVLFSSVGYPNICRAAPKKPFIKFNVLDHITHLVLTGDSDFTHDLAPLSQLSITSTLRDFRASASLLTTVPCRDILITGPGILSPTTKLEGLTHLEVSAINYFKIQIDIPDIPGIERSYIRFPSDAPRLALKCAALDILESHCHSFYEVNLTHNGDRIDNSIPIGDIRSVTVAGGEQLPLDCVSIELRIQGLNSDGSLLETDKRATIDYDRRFPVYYILYKLAKEASIPVKELILKKEDRVLTEGDLHQSICDFLPDPPVLYVQVPAVTVQLTHQKYKYSHIIQSPLLFSIFDLKRELCKKDTKLKLATLQVFVPSTGLLLDDRSYLCSLGITKDITLYYLAPAEGSRVAQVYRLHFIDLSGKPVIRETNNPDDTLGHFAQYFHNEPDLIAFLQCGEPLPRETKVSQCILDPSFPIDVSLSPPPVASEEPPIESHDFAFTVSGKSESIKLGESATVADLVDAVSERLEIDPTLLRVSISSGPIPSSPDVPLTSVTEAIQIDLIPTQGIRPIDFVYEGHHETLNVDVDAPISALKDVLVAKWPEIDPKFLKVSFMDFFVDDDMTINDIGDDVTELIVVNDAPLPPAVAAVAAVAPPAIPAQVPPLPSPQGSPPIKVKKEYTIALKGAVIPRIAKFQLDPSAKFREIEPLVRARWNLATVEFVQEDRNSGIETRLSPDLTIGEINIEQFDLWVQEAALLVVADPRKSLRLTESTRGTDSMGLLTSTARRASGMVTLSFKLEERGDVFKLTFPKGDTIGNVKVKVAEHCRVTREYVTLLFHGRSLKDGFILDRLRIGNHSLMVYLKSDAEVVLVHGKRG